MIYVATGNTLTITGPANVRVSGKPALSGTQPVPGSVPGTDETATTAAKEPHNGKPQPAHTTA